MLDIKNLQVKAEDKQILNGINLHVNAGEVHAIMGPNGSGKSTLSYALMGHQSYEITEGQILVDGVDVSELGADVRAGIEQHLRKLGIAVQRGPVQRRHAIALRGIHVGALLEQLLYS